MKIGAFTPPEIRAAILHENLHGNETPSERLPAMCLETAGFRVRLAAHDGRPLGSVDQRVLEPFLSRDPDAGVHDLFVVPRRVTAHFEMPQDTPGNITGELGDDEWRIRSHHWETYWNRRDPAVVTCDYFGSPMTLIHALRLFLAHRMLQDGRGFLLHASAAVWQNRTFVFLGHSGAGKSTSAYHTPGTLLSDETVAILPGPDGRLFALGTPFGGEHFPCAEVGPDPVFLFVEKSPRNARKCLPTRNAVARLLSQVVLFPFAPLPLWDAAAEMVERILEHHAVEILEAQKDGSFWEECIP